MSAYAYRDRNRTEVIYASEAMTENIDTLFFCPNKDCNAHLHICAVDGSRKAYFRATHKQFPHIDNCPFASSANHFDSDKFNEQAFSFDDAINNLFLVKKESERNRNQRNIGEHNNGEPNKQPIKTLRQIYSMCKSRPVTDMYAGKKIRDMILDDRSAYYYTKGCFGNKIVEARRQVGYFYEDKSKKIFLKAPTESGKDTFVLQFDEEKIYNKIRTEIYNNRDRLFVVAGKWERIKQYDYFISNIYSDRQVKVIR